MTANVQHKIVPPAALLKDLDPTCLFQAFMRDMIQRRKTGSQQLHRIVQQAKLNLILGHGPVTGPDVRLTGVDRFEVGKVTGQ